MQLIIPLIEKKQKDLEQCRFLLWLENKNIPVEQRLSFTPSMIFFIMGFNDILNLLKINPPNNKLESIITTHCEEDIEHWQWYLNDLERLGFDLNTWGPDLPTFMKNLWAKETTAVRQLVYHCVAYHLNYKNKLIDLVLLEVLEATFGAFIGPMVKCVQEAGLWNNLEFFGRIHHDAESAHSSGSWVENESVDNILYEFDLDDKTRLLANEMIIDLFSRFNMMFDTWYESRKVFQARPNYLTKDMHQTLDA